MSFRFDISKVTQAAALLLAREPNYRTEYLRLLKLLYIADRESLKETYRPITGDEVVAMKLGPVLDGTYNLLKPAGTDTRWKSFIKTDGYFVQLSADPGRGQLAVYEREKLANVSFRYKNHSWTQMSDVTHDFPEWRDPGNSMYSIPLSAILKEIGLTVDEIADIERDKLSEKYEDHVFGV